MICREHLEAIRSFNQAYEIFVRKNSLAGQAATKAATAYIQGIMMTEYMDESMQETKKAIDLFKERKDFLKMSMLYRWMAILARHSN